MVISKDLIIAGAVLITCVVLLTLALLPDPKKTDAAGETPPVAKSDDAGRTLPPDNVRGTSGSDVGLDEITGRTPPPIGPDTSVGASSGSFGVVIASSSSSGTTGFGSSGGTGFGVASSSSGPSIFDTGTLTGLGSSSSGTGGLFGDLGSTGLGTLTTTTTASETTHVVAKGEFLSDISEKYYKTPHQWKLIADANKVDPHSLKVGQKLRIPAAPSVTGSAGRTGAIAAVPGSYVVKKGDSYWTIARDQLGDSSRFREIEKLNGDRDLKIGESIKLPSTTVPAPERRATAGAGAAEVPAGATVHVVKEGEVLGDIAKQHLGSARRWNEIAKANNIGSPEDLKVGQRLVIPGGGRSATTTTTGGVTAAPPRPAAASRQHVVARGDTLGSLSRKYYGREDKWQKIRDANPGINATNLPVGRSITIPDVPAPAGEAGAIPVRPSFADPVWGQPGASLGRPAGAGTTSSASTTPGGLFAPTSGSAGNAWGTTTGGTSTDAFSRPSGASTLPSSSFGTTPSSSFGTTPGATSGASFSTTSGATSGASFNTTSGATSGTTTSGDPFGALQ